MLHYCHKLHYYDLSKWVPGFLNWVPGFSNGVPGFLNVVHVFLDVVPGFWNGYTQFPKRGKTLLSCQIELSGKSVLILDKKQLFFFYL